MDRTGRPQEEGNGQLNEHPGLDHVLRTPQQPLQGMLIFLLPLQWEVMAQGG